MFKHRLGWTAFLVGMILVLTGQLALAAEFSADMVASTRGQSATGAIYVKGKNVRQEVKVGGNTQITIFNAQKKMVWVANPAQKKYIGTPIPAKELAAVVDQARGLPPFAALAKRGFIVKKLGTETVNGYPCDKTQVTSKDGKAKMVIWYSKKLGLAMKGEITSPSGKQTITQRQEYKNVKERKLSDSLFLPPAGYKQVVPKPMAGPGAGPMPKAGPSARPMPPVVPGRGR